MALMNRQGPAGPAGLLLPQPGAAQLWSAGTYNRGDVRRRVNATYACLAAGTTSDPQADAVNWMLLSQDGSNASNAKSLVRLGGNKSSGTAVGSLAITVPAGGHTVGNLLVIPVMVGFSGSANPLPVTVTGDGGTWDNHAASTNVYHVEAVSAVANLGGSSGQYRLQLCWCILTTALTAGDVITVTFSASTQSDLAADSAEFTNVAARDVVAVANNLTGTTISAGSMTPSAGGDLLITILSGVTPTSLNVGQVPVNSITVTGTVTRGFIWTYSLLPNNTAVNPSETVASSAVLAATGMLFR